MTEQWKPFFTSVGLACIPAVVNHQQGWGLLWNRSPMVRWGCRWVRSSFVLGAFLVTARKKERVHVKRRQPAQCVPGLFVTSPPVCALCKWAGGLGGTAPWETAGANPACWTGEHFSIKHPPTPLSSRTHTHKQTHARTNTPRTACSRRSLKQTSQGEHKGARTQLLSQ